MVVLSAGLAGAAAAQTTAEERYAAPADKIPVLKGRVEEQEAYLQARIGEISAVGVQLEEAQTRVDGAPTSSGSRATCIVARIVEPISQKAYRKPYKVSAERYGFGEDWYVLKVLGVAEGYRCLAGDDTVRPYRPYI